MSQVLILQAPISFLVEWETTSTILMYLEFTSDCDFVYRFDSVGYYSLNHLTYSDQGISQLLISLAITTFYTLSNNGKT